MFGAEGGGSVIGMEGSSEAGEGCGHCCEFF